MNRIQLSEGTFRELRDFIYRHSGIYINDTKKYLIENRLQRRVLEKHLGSFEDYLYLIKYSGNGTELSELLDAITTNETYFFREPQHFEIIMNILLQERLKAGASRIRIWSAACSTGEEPYTIAMLLHERGETYRKRVEIYGTDICNRALQSAREGLYSSYSVRNLPKEYLKKYFTPENGNYRLSEEIKQMVRFMRANIVKPQETRSLRGIDIILCRNVLIYFDDKAKKTAVSGLYDSLNPGGVLMVGASETLHNITRAFRPEVHNRTVLYRKV